MPRYTSYPTVPFWDTAEPDSDRWKLTVQDTFKATNKTEGISLSSPNGKLVVRSRGGELILDGLGPQQTVARTGRVVGRVHWSPDSAFLMFLERAEKWDPMALRVLDNVVYVTVYRCRDGRKGYLRAFGEGAAAAPWAWLRIPSELLSGR